MKLKTIKLQGKDYVQVLERIKYFRENVKNGAIQTEVQIIGDRSIFTAKIYIDDKLVATGHSMKNITQEFMLEKAETRAIGRALGIAGIGIDCGVSTYDEVREYLEQSTKKKSPREHFDDLLKEIEPEEKRKLLSDLGMLKDGIVNIKGATLDQIKKGIELIEKEGE